MLWILKTYAITAVLSLLVLVLLAKFTVWGRQYWRITGDYFKGRKSIGVWAWVAVLLLSTIISVRLDVLLSYYGNDLFTSLQVAFQGRGADNDEMRESGIHGFWMSLIVFAILATIYISRVMLDIYLTQRFIIRWRMWLTDRVTRLARRPCLLPDPVHRQRHRQPGSAHPVRRRHLHRGRRVVAQHPDGGNLEHAVVRRDQLVGDGRFVHGDPVEPVRSLTMFGLTLGHALFWVVLIYVVFATIIAFWIGHPLIRLSFRNELTNAVFRYALVRLRDAAEAVGFYRGEDAERGLLRTKFAAIIANYRRFVNRTIALTGWNLSMSQIINPLPLVIQAPRLFKGQIDLGDVTQSSSAFGSIHDSLSFFRNAYDSFAAYRAAIIRLHGLVETNQAARELPTLTTVDSHDGSVELKRVEVRTPSGAQLVDPLDVRLEPGETLVITGRSGPARRRCCAAWPSCGHTPRGRCAGPPRTTPRCSCPRCPYVPLGDLRTVVSHPANSGEISDENLMRALSQVALSHLSNRLNDAQDWAKVLSPGEQQRIAFARVLLTRPRAVFLDESTSALDEGLEFALYDLVRTELPNTILVSVSHRHTVEQHHTRHLELLGEGEWRLGRIAGTEPAPV